jgi:hypothetical protein
MSQDHQHDIPWKPNEHYPDWRPWIWVDVEMLCGCTLNERPDFLGFADELQQERGWDVARTAGWGSHETSGENPVLAIKVRRKSLQ